MASTKARIFASGVRSEATTAATRRSHPPNMSREDLAVERRLAAEVVVDHRLVDAGGAGDAVDVGAGVAAGGELGGGGGEHAGAGIDGRRGARGRVLDACN